MVVTVLCVVSNTILMSCSVANTASHSTTCINDDGCPPAIVVLGSGGFGRALVTAIVLSDHPSLVVVGTRTPNSTKAVELQTYLSSLMPPRTKTTDMCARGVQVNNVVDAVQKTDVILVAQLSFFSNTEAKACVKPFDSAGKSCHQYKQSFKAWRDIQ